jgi:hypothetical protein
VYIMNDDPSLDREYKKGYHTGRAAAYQTSAHLLGTLLDRCASEQRVPSPTELRALQHEMEGHQLRAEDEANAPDEAARLSAQKLANEQLAEALKTGEKTLHGNGGF